MQPGTTSQQPGSRDLAYILPKVLSIAGLADMEHPVPGTGVR